MMSCIAAAFVEEALGDDGFFALGMVPRIARPAVTYSAGLLGADCRQTASALSQFTASNEIGGIVLL